MSTVKNRWPELLKEIDPEIQESFNFGEQLIVQDDIVYRGEKIVVQASLRPKYVKQIHEGHPGREAMKNRVPVIIISY